MDEAEEFVRTHARRTDPQTSKTAALKASYNASSDQQKVLDVIVSEHHKMDGVGYVRIAKLNGWNPWDSREKGRRRISDLLLLGLVYETGDVEITYNPHDGTKVERYKVRATLKGLDHHAKVFDC